MSATTADNPISTVLERAAASSHLRDYDVHLSTDPSAAAPPPNSDHQPRASQQRSHSNPPNWNGAHRGVPPHRPVNRDLDFSQRPWNGQLVGDAFVFTMFTGVFTIWNLNWLWRNTGGRWNNRLFRYKVGGEI
ncbi:hypothetical protein M406DRAFT_35761 [Cryphonectria parasitica EP155]|uniref:Uncharacterized protein n=1 Tax=Cryphonectria parasitica (strain ATCC 38755 / EP155) TaxID=660469 RepID=A0A9P5CUY0_CRYP1|nr:uncharacterized protein M406DRAFT_35761 [Cryphonectria parasitica EP155]KAF3770721.1 hypothetical protein M406DRAFT_35761 [Cryphonectria parasitica EP155]